MYYLSLLFSLPCLVLTIIMMHVEDGSRFYHFFNINKAYGCLVISVIFIVIGLIAEKKE